MSDDSVFSQHLRLIQQEESKWSASDREEFDRLQSLRLPPLELKPTRWMKFKKQIKAGVPLFVTASLAVVTFVSLYKTNVNEYTAKGSVQVSVFWERAGKVSPLNAESELKDGDRVGANVISSEAGIAYWAITDNSFKPISDITDIEGSKIILEPGVKAQFKFSFELVAPNQGENLIVVVCSKSQTKSDVKPVNSLFDHEFTAKLLTAQQIRASDCTFVGYRLRNLP